MAVRYGIGLAEHDTEGRVITAEFPDFYLVNVYTPNSGAELLRLDYRQQWDLAFYDFLKKLEADKPVLVCGDMNVAHTDIDLANPAAKAVIRRELPEVMNSPLLSFAQSMTLRQVLSLAGNIPQEKRDRILAALKEA